MNTGLAGGNTTAVAAGIITVPTAATDLHGEAAANVVKNGKGRVRTGVNTEKEKRSPPEVLPAVTAKVREILQVLVDLFGNLVVVGTRFQAAGMLVIQEIRITGVTVRMRPPALGAT